MRKKTKRPTIKTTNIMKDYTKQHYAVLVPMFVAAMILMAATEYPKERTETPVVGNDTVVAVQDTAETRLERLAEAFAFVESRDNPNLVNTKEDAVGWLQIRPIMVAEANRISGVDMFWLEDRETKSGSFIIFAKIMEAKNLELDIRKACQIWNPNGGKAYYQKVLSAFNAKSNTKSNTK